MTHKVGVVDAAPPEHEAATTVIKAKSSALFDPLSVADSSFRATCPTVAPQAAATDIVTLCVAPASKLNVPKGLVTLLAHPKSIVSNKEILLTVEPEVFSTVKVISFVSHGLIVSFLGAVTVISEVCFVPNHSDAVIVQVEPLVSTPLLHSKANPLS